ncbi:hypothetical protein AAG570_000982, partial [Ranatra chinensis]
GANSYGQLGHGRASNECLSPREVDLSELDLNLGDIVSLAAGGGHSFIVQASGHVFGCGLNNAGQLCHQKNTEITKFIPIDNLSDRNVIQISSKWDSTFALTRNHECLGWGANSYGQLGSPPTSLLTTRQPITLIPYLAQQVEAGLRHCAILTPEGYVMTSGDNRKGQLGHPPSQSFQPVCDLSNVRSVACGQHHTLALTANDRLYGWGCNKFGQLGLNPELQPNVRSPTEIPVPPGSIDGCTIVLSGWTHSAMLTGSGTVINWGRNKYGQLGVPPEQKPNGWKPEVLEDVRKVVQLELGSEHTLALLEDGVVMSWGWNEHGSCGVNHTQDVTTPRSIQLSGKAMMVAAGTGHSFAVIH